MAREKKPTPTRKPDHREVIKEDRSRVRTYDDRTPARTPERKIHDVVDTAPPPEPIKKK